MPVLDQISLFLISLVANVLSAMAGGGAGLLQLPALIFLGLPLSMALATHKIASVALGLGATLRHARQGHLRLGFAVLMLVAGLPGVVLGANLVLNIPAELAELALGLLTLGLAVYSLFKKQLGQVYQPRRRDRLGYCIGVLVLFLLGVLNGSLTSGTGLFVTVWLIVWFGLDFTRATAYTMILVGLFWNGTGALTLALQTPVKWSWLPALLLGSLVGGYVGATLALRYANPLIKRVFEGVTMAVGVALILQSF